ncbi:MAG: hemerythrin family protein [Burkholderiaceae bacterium]
MPNAEDLGNLKVWDPRLETGVSTLDLQHRILFDLLQGLRHLGDAGESPALAQVLEQMRSYAGYHFRYEEDWVRKHARHLVGHPLIAVHTRLHERFNHDMSGFEARLEDGTLAVDELREFVQRWLVRHIIEQDLPMISALQGRSGTPAGPAG